MQQKPQRYADITPEMIQDWKAKHGQYSLSEVAIDIAEVDGKNVQAKFIIAIPNQETFYAINDNNNDAAKANKLIIGNCVLGGDMDYIDKDAQVYAAVLNNCAALLREKPSVVKKL